MDVNRNQKQKIADHIINYFKGTSNKTIAIWGLAFKPNTDDIREAPAIETIDKLLENGFKIKAYDPEAMTNINALYGDKITLCKDPYSTLEDCDALAILTEWNVFRTPNYNSIKSLLNNPLIFDGRNLYDLNNMKDLGFKYYSIGRKIIL